MTNQPVRTGIVQHGHCICLAPTGTPANTSTNLLRLDHGSGGVGVRTIIELFQHVELLHELRVNVFLRGAAIDAFGTNLINLRALGDQIS
jgi:hypothetical protein